MIFIAELCQNHNGDPKILEDMIIAASENGADYCKIQNIYADDLTFRDRFEEGVFENENIKVIKRPYKNEYERLKKLELSYETQIKFIELCKKNNVKALTTCFTIHRVEELSKFDWDLIKVASYDCGSLKMIKKIAENFKEIIISTGASYDKEIKETADYLNSINHKFTFLHCVTIYPTPLESLNLSRLNYLQQFTKSVGYSDHSLVKSDNLIASKCAIYLGASVLERHFTILKEDQTKDGPVSIGPSHLSDLIKFSKMNKEDQLNYLNNECKNWKQLVMGNIDRTMSNIELLNRDYYRGRFAERIGTNNYNYNW